MEFLIMVKSDSFVDFIHPFIHLDLENISQVHFNRFRNALIDFELVAGCRPQHPAGLLYMNATHNWWGVANEAEVAQRVFDLDDWNIYSLALWTPFYTTEELFINFWWTPRKGQLMHAPNHTEPSPQDLKGRMYESKTLFLDPERWYPFPYHYRPFRAYRITRYFGVGDKMKWIVC